MKTLALLFFAALALAQPPPANIGINSTRVNGGISPDCLKVNANGTLGQQACGGAGGVTSITAGTGISVNAATGSVTVTNTSPGASPAGPTNSLQFNAGGGLLGASSDLAYTTTSVNAASIFSGTGLNDLYSSGSYTDGAANPNATFNSCIDSTGTPDTFKWQKNGGSFTTGVAIDGTAQALSDGVTLTFAATTGHTLNDCWLTITATVTSLKSSRLALGPNGDANNTNGVYFQDYNFVGQTGIASYVAIRDGANSTNQIYGIDGAVDDSNDSTATSRDWLVGIGGEPYHASPGTLNAMVGFAALPFSASGGTVTGIYGVYSKPYTHGNVTNEYGLWHQSAIGGGGTLPNAYGVYIDHTQAFGTVNLNVAFYSADQSSSDGGTIKNSYYSWFDSLGVKRVKEDNSFDGVGQAIEALYNPQFPKYTPGAVNYERLIEGEWNGNVSEIGNYAGGTGTVRALKLMGSQFSFGTASNISTTTFTGAGLDDGYFNGTYTGATLTYCAKIDVTGTPDTFKWGTNGACDNGATGVAITGANQTLSSGVVIKFAATTGHTLDDKWSAVATAAATNMTFDQTTLTTPTVNIQNSSFAFDGMTCTIVAGAIACS